MVSRNENISSALRPRLLLVALAGIGLLVGADRASAQKMCYVASDAIFDRLPQAIDARKKLDEMQGAWKREIQKREQEIATLRRDIDANRLLWSEQERSEKEGKLRDAEATLAQFRMDRYGPNGQFEKEYRTLMAPVIDLIQAAVDAEAADKGYDFVFDKSSRGLPMLVANPQFDITYGVLKRLGVTVDPAELQANQPKKPSLLDQLPAGIRDRIDADGSVKIGDPSVQVKGPISAETAIDPNRLLTPVEPVGKPLEVVDPNEKDPE